MRELPLDRKFGPIECFFNGRNRAFHIFAENSRSTASISVILCSIHRQFNKDHSESRLVEREPFVRASCRKKGNRGGRNRRTYGDPAARFREAWRSYVFPALLCNQEIENPGRGYVFSGSAVEIRGLVGGASGLGESRKMAVFTLFDLAGAIRVRFP
jgi:hypothetical protein